MDLEHNQYRSFQGLTCLMQISTRTEDFVVDTFKLRVHIGPYLREVFKDPTKKKVRYTWLMFLLIQHLLLYVDRVYGYLGHAWSRSRYCVVATGFWHICLQYV